MADLPTREEILRWKEDQSQFLKQGYGRDSYVDRVAKLLALIDVDTERWKEMEFGGRATAHERCASCGRFLSGGSQINHDAGCWLAARLALTEGA